MSLNYLLILHVILIPVWRLKAKCDDILILNILKSAVILTLASFDLHSVVFLAVRTNGCRSLLMRGVMEG